MGGSTIATSETKIEALKLQSSAYGATIPVVGGVNRIPGNLIWYGDFKSTPHTSTEGQGGKGGGVKTQSTSYTYSASVLMGICQGPIGGIARVWKGKEVFEGGWSAANVQRQVDTYTLPASGTMATTLSHAATMIGSPDVSYDITISYTSDTTGATWSVTETRRLADGTDYSLVAGVMTFNRDDLRGTLVKIAYQWGSGAPDLSPLATLGISLANGDMSQTAATWLATAHPGEAPAYPGLAYVHAQNYQLGSGAQVDNHSFEVQGSGAYRYGSTTPDANPAEFAADLLANGRYGARLPVGRLDVKAWIDYCAAAGLLMSPLLTEQQRASDFVDEACRLTNSAPVWSVDRLRIVPYGDTAVTGNGVTFTPNVTPLYDLDDDSWLQDGNDDPLQWSLKEPADRYNHVRVEFCDRSNYYNKTIAEAKDDADISVNGLRTMSTISAPWICDAAVARLVAQLVLQRSLNISGSGRVVLPWAYCLLECMDLVTITDAALGFGKLPVRITSIGENEDGRLDVELEDWPLGTASATRYPSQVAGGFLHDYNASPGNVDTPVIFEAPGALSVTGLEVFAAVRGTSPLWGGCQVWVSLDGTQYKLAGTVYGGSRYGTLSSAVSSTAAVQGLGSQQLLSGTAADAAALQTLCWIGGASQEYLAYTTATLTGAGAYTLGGLVRAAHGTASVAHSAGDAFVRVDDRIARSGALDPALAGRQIHFKFLSFNSYGGAIQGLADVVDYTYTITGMFVGSVGGGSPTLEIKPDVATIVISPQGTVESFAPARAEIKVSAADGSDATALWTITKAETTTVSTLTGTSPKVLQVTGFNSQKVLDYWDSVLIQCHFDGSAKDTSKYGNLPSVSTGAGKVVTYSTTEKVFGTHGAVFPGNGGGGGNGGYIQWGPNPSFRSNGAPWSMKIRVKFSDLSNIGVPRAVCGNDVRAIHVYLDGSNRAYFIASWDSAVGTKIVSQQLAGLPAPGLQTNTWYALEFSYNSDGNLRLYINGVHAAPTVTGVGVGVSDNLSTPVNQAGSTYMRIGASYLPMTYPDQHHFGAVDEFQYQVGTDMHTAAYTVETDPFADGAYSAANYIDITATDAGGTKTLTGRFTLTTVVKAAQVITSRMSVNLITLKADETGVVTSYTGASAQAFVLQDGADVTSLWQVTAFCADSTVGFSVSGSVITITSVTPAFDNTTFTVYASRPGYATQTLSFSLRKFVNAVSQVMDVRFTPALITVPATLNGTVLDYSTAKTLVQIFRGTTDETSLWSILGTGTSVQGATLALDSGYVKITAMSVDYTYATLVMTRSGYSDIIRTLPIQKVKTLPNVGLQSPNARNDNGPPTGPLNLVAVASGSVTMGIRITPDGVIETTINGSTWVKYADWFWPNSSGIGASNEVRGYLESGTLDAGSATMAAQNISTTRTWLKTASSFGLSTAQFTLIIGAPGNNSSFGNVINMRINLTANVTA